MLQDPNPIDPVKTGRIVFAINGNKVPFDAEMIPKLFVAYVAAVRAEYYAGVDAARGDDFGTVFHEEIRHAMRDRSELVDWLENNMDWHTEKADEIGVLYEAVWAAGRCASGEEKGANDGTERQTPQNNQ